MVKFSKKALTLILTFALLLSCLITPGIVSAEGSEKPDIWDGSVATSFAGGSGTEDDPYIIKTPEQLARMLDTFGGSLYYELANDIYLNDVTEENWYDDATNNEWFIGYRQSSSNFKYYNNKKTKYDYFNGNIDGNGHTVYGLWYKKTTTDPTENPISDYSGLIPSAKSAEIKNLAIDKAYIVANNSAAGFVGNNGTGGGGGTVSFKSCFAGENVYVESLTGNPAAGFVGLLEGHDDGRYKTYINNCYSLIPEANLVNNGSDFKKNAFIGYPYNTVFKVSNSYCIGSPFSASRKESVSTLGADGYSNVYATADYAYDSDKSHYTIVAAEDMKGNAARTKMPGLADGFVLTESYPELKAFVFGNDYNIWGGFIAEPADADKNGEYEIYTAEELAWYVAKGGKAKLMNDIYLNDMKVTVTDGNATMTKLTDETVTLSADDPSLREWYGEGTELKETNEDDTLSYTFNGNGYAVNGLYYNKLKNGDNNCRYGLFNNIRYGTADIKGLGIENCYMLTGSNYAAACIIGYVNYAYYTISECYLAESVYHESGSAYAGGIVGGGNPPYKYDEEGKITTELDTEKKPEIRDCISLATLKCTGTPYAIATYFKDEAMSITNCLVANGYSAFNARKATATNVYHKITDNSTIQGPYALAAAPNLDTTKVYAVKAKGKFPMLRVRGTAIGDVDENGIGANLDDACELRCTLIEYNSWVNTDFTRDGVTDICDLVGISNKAIANAAAEEEAAKLLLDDVYVASTGSDSNNGTEDAPVATLAKAYSLVKDAGCINLVDTVETSSMPKGDKMIYIAGGKLYMSSMSTVNVGCDTYFCDTAIVFADDSTVYANGNDLLIESSVTVEGIPAAIYGGGNSPVAETNLTLKAGSYKAIYGGGNSGEVLGDTNLTLAGTVNDKLPLTEKNSSYIYGGGNTGKVYGNTNVTVKGSVNAANLDHTSHTAIARLYGGSKNGAVDGSTFVTVAENAEFNYIYGGCASGTVGKATNIDFSGNAMAIYGGSGTVTETNVTVNDGGWVYQVFGGCEGSSMTGNTNVTLNGGTVERRVFGGCYNDAGESLTANWPATPNKVTGTMTVTISSEVSVTGELLKDSGIAARSRYGSKIDGETAVIKFVDQAAYNKLKGKLNISGLYTIESSYDELWIAGVKQ